MQSWEWPNNSLNTKFPNFSCLTWKLFRVNDYHLYLSRVWVFHEQSFNLKITKFNCPWHPLNVWCLVHKDFLSKTVPTLPCYLPGHWTYHRDQYPALSGIRCEYDTANAGYWLLHKAQRPDKSNALWVQSS